MRVLFIVKCFLRVTMAVLTEVPRTKWKCPGVYSRIAKALQKTYQWYHNTLCVSTYVSWYTHCSRKYHIQSFSTGATGLRLCSGRQSCITSYMELCDPFTHLILGGIIVPARRSWKISIMSQSNKQNVQNKTKRVNNFNERLGAFALTHLGRLTHICIGNLPIISSDHGLSALAPNHYMNQCWNNVNWAFTNKLQ